MRPHGIELQPTDPAVPPGRPTGSRAPLERARRWMDAYRQNPGFPHPARPDDLRASFVRSGLTTADLAELLPEVATLPRLEELVIIEEGLGALPEEIGLLTGLRFLQLSGCGLAELPGAIGRLTALETLQVSTNALTALPEEIGSLTRLRHLRAGFNQLSDLPDSLDRLTCLEELDVTSNPFPGRPAVLDRLPATARVSIDVGWGTPADARPIEGQVPDTSGDLPGWAADPFDGEPLWAGHHQYYVHGEGPEVWEEGFTAVQANDGVAAVGTYLALIDTGRQHGTVTVRLEVADTLSPPEGVAAAFDLLLPDGVLVVSGYEGRGRCRHDFGRPTRCRVLVEVSGRDAGNEDEDEADGVERHRVTVVPTDRERPRWRSAADDGVGRALGSGAAHVADWDPAAEP